MEQKTYYWQSLFINRSIRLVGGLVKLIGFIYHAIFPRRRFRIPKSEKSFYSKYFGKKQLPNQKVTRILWQTNYTDRLTLPLYINYLFNRWMTIDYEFRFLDHDDRLDFIKSYGNSAILETYKSLNVGAAQADLWRYLALREFGGVYLDMDGCIVCPLNKIIKHDTLNMYCETKNDFTNYFIATEKGHSIMAEVIDKVVENIQQKKTENGVYFLTGPKPLNDALNVSEYVSRNYRVLCVQGIFSNEYFQYVLDGKKKWTRLGIDAIFR